MTETTDMLAATETISAPAPRWKLRPAGEAIPYVGMVWCSDGNKVWLLQSTGLATQFVNADRIQFWTVADMPAPPTATEVYALTNAAS